MSSLVQIDGSLGEGVSIYSIRNNSRVLSLLFEYIRLYQIEFGEYILPSNTNNI